MGGCTSTHAVEEPEPAEDVGDADAQSDIVEPGAPLPRRTSFVKAKHKKQRMPAKDMVRSATLEREQTKTRRAGARQMAISKKIEMLTRGGDGSKSRLFGAQQQAQQQGQQQPPAQQQNNPLMAMQQSHGGAVVSMSGQGAAAPMAPTPAQGQMGAVPLPAQMRRSESKQSADGASVEGVAHSVQPGMDGISETTRSERVPSADADTTNTGDTISTLTDDYFSEEERGLYERPRPKPDAVSKAPQFEWRRGELLGAGAFGHVYLGLNCLNGQLMAVKQVPLDEEIVSADRDQPDSRVKALEREIDVLRSLKNEHIVEYLGMNTEDGNLNIFLEFVPAGSIASLLKRFGRFNESLVKIYTQQILLGLVYLHSHQIVHRDIKGANVLVDIRGTCKLADFGASAYWLDLCKERPSLQGTPYWMAPEVIRQQGHGRKVDIWSVGCTVIEMFTGRPPWSEFNSQPAAMFHIANATAPPKLPDEMPEEMRDFVLNCLERDPRKRPNALQLLNHPFIAGHSGGETRETSTSLPLSPTNLFRDRSVQSSKTAQLLAPSVEVQVPVTASPSTSAVKRSSRSGREDDAPSRRSLAPSVCSVQLYPAIEEGKADDAIAAKGASEADVNAYLATHFMNIMNNVNGDFQRRVQQYVAVPDAAPMS